MGWMIRSSNSGMSKKFCLLQNIQIFPGAQAASNSVSTGVVSCGYRCRVMRQATDIHLGLRLRMMC
jgi:hypothetical protein